VVSAADPYGRNLGFLDRSHFFFQVVPQLYSRGWVDPVPDPLLTVYSLIIENRGFTVTKTKTFYSTHKMFRL
jgi:hypothetical protein